MLKKEKFGNSQEREGDSVDKNLINADTKRQIERIMTLKSISEDEAIILVLDSYAARHARMLEKTVVASERAMMKMKEDI
ncbi:hypothetical protein HUG20_08495 [Salicibibacter cibi]|uniref:Uncharacterized protein n=1 Tax=Salicibibacter cibi TaxID=2743001 RepID=A0A7T7CFE8_9BACI|nr:hypothetical protein [Salicibibacter cibi]QQK79919.1 hypothetical protein HUG20_08495 [Salicibibacter cibi]